MMVPDHPTPGTTDFEHLATICFTAVNHLKTKPESVESRHMIVAAIQAAGLVASHLGSGTGGGIASAVEQLAGRLAAVEDRLNDLKADRLNGGSENESPCRVVAVERIRPQPKTPSNWLFVVELNAAAHNRAAARADAQHLPVEAVIIQALEAGLSTPG